ncbi:glutamate 5-kinase [Lacimicrobium alkaliphilum]|uniref:Glutamate 5-kinase n=1 Tax=Lacimicrobium alkaliphilum TaxID=1526571 RepID=A0ABQ1R5Y0_9ALTE|nr:glutamate 5-kinase [Lacimicrobium alkaliphilum]GGD57275.1 glutamate 5-kinase [Lacimicrobium alkaliphilum]
MRQQGSNNPISFSWQRAVIKVGSALISPHGDGCKTASLLALAQFVNESRSAGKEVILVSSGAVAAGKNAFTLSHSPTLSEKQAMAAVGQTRMMANWARLFDSPTAQILLTHGDIRNRDHYLNIKGTIRELLAHGMLPVINENDSVATDELKFGDNDNLAALVALVAEADTLLICTDVDGLYNSDPRSDADAQLLRRVEKIDPQIMALAGGAGSKVGTGGMQTKLQAARKASHNGIQTIIANGFKSHTFTQLARGVVPGTLFVPPLSRGKAKKNWLMHSLRAKGWVFIDHGAAEAIANRGASLLPVGITKVEGGFNAGEAVEVIFQHEPVAIGLCQYDARTLTEIAGLNRQQIEQQLGYCSYSVAMHRDDLVLF